VAGYLEQVQSTSKFWWDLDTVLEWLDKKMTAAFHDVHRLAEAEGVYPREAAFIVAMERVIKAMQQRGWF
jgi:glutamate dehydrogenase (NAD(P)+)